MRKIALMMVVLLLATAFACAHAQDYDTVMTIASPTYARSGPGTGKQIVFELPARNTYAWTGDMKRDGRGVVWYGIYYRGDIFWLSGLHSILYNSISGQVHNEGRNGANSKNCSVYAKRGTYIYSGPGTGYSAIGYMDAGMGADFTGFKEKSGGQTWYQVSYYSIGGWVSSNDTKIK